MSTLRNGKDGWNRQIQSWCATILLFLLYFWQNENIFFFFDISANIEWLLSLITHQMSKKNDPEILFLTPRNVKRDRMDLFATYY